MTLKVLFVCYGNINRSPFAEEWFNDYCRKNGENASSSSAGIAAKDYGEYNGRVLTQFSPSLCVSCSVIAPLDSSVCDVVRRALQSREFSRKKIVCLDIPDYFRRDLPDPAGVCRWSPMFARAYLDRYHPTKIGPAFMSLLLEERVGLLLGNGE